MKANQEAFESLLLILKLYVVESVKRKAWQETLFERQLIRIQLGLVSSSLITILRLDLFILGLVDQVDVCCGTGSIGLSLAGQVGQVLGLDIVDTAVEAAMSNAMKNNVTNCEFYPGR